MIFAQFDQVRYESRFLRFLPQYFLDFLHTHFLSFIYSF